MSDNNYQQASQAFKTEQASKRKPPRANKTWAPEEDKTVIRMLGGGVSTQRIAEQIGRTEQAVKQRISSHNLSISVDILRGEVERDTDKRYPWMSQTMNTIDWAVGILSFCAGYAVAYIVINVGG